MVRLGINVKKLQGLAIKVDTILRDEMRSEGMKCKHAEARIYNLRTVGVQGDNRTYRYPAEITLKQPKHRNGRAYPESELNDFLQRLSNRITNEISEVNRVVYVTPGRDDRIS